MIGLDVAADNAVVRLSGQPSQRIFAVGPLARGAFWEIIAIPDIRQQCAELADNLAATLFDSKIPFGRADFSRSSFDNLRT